MTDAPAAVGSTFRLFFALVPDVEARRALSVLAGEVARAAGGRAPREQNLHVTVAFLGAVPRVQMPAVLEIGARAAATGEPFALTLDHLGAFRGAGVVWAATQRIPSSLQGIFEALQGGMRGAGLRAEHRSFHPHVTLARRCTRPLPSRTMSPIAWPVEWLVLMASTTLPQGPRYSELATWHLAAET